MIIGVDVGGTFTDVVAFDGATVKTAKVATTADQSEGILSGAGELARRTESLLLGTTIATNTLLERTGARTALITDPGFEDILEIGRQDRPSLYDSFSDRPEPLVPREWRTSNPDSGFLADAEAVAISLLNAYRDNAPEQAVAAALLVRNPHLSLSSAVAPEFREFERTSTTVLNAYLMPMVEDYLDGVARRIRESSFADDTKVMRSSGGLMTLPDAAALPAAILLSGPAGGAMAAGALGEKLGVPVIAFDMGGTSTDVCRIEGGRPEIVYQRAIEGYVCQLPSAAVHTVGAGGGSIGWVDPGGSLRVGPQSAGADPGPACYGRGGSDATVTDANVALGRIGPDARLGGKLAIDPSLSLRALGHLGERAGLNPEKTALGMLQVIGEVMAGALRRVSIEQGSDPRESWLVAFGGAGGLQATALAKRLGMPGVLVPPHGGVFSALGLLLSPPRVDLAQGTLITADQHSCLDHALAELVETALGQMPSARMATRCDVRYVGQSHELTVDYGAGDGWSTMVDRFNRLHHDRNGFSRPGDPVEVVTLRAEAKGQAPIHLDDLPVWSARELAVVATREVVTESGRARATTRNRAGLNPGDEVVGPAVIEETEATTYLGEGEQLRVLQNGTLEITW